MRNIIVADLKQIPLEKQLIEIVERKGLGHPDYICDAVADRISIGLSRVYLEKAGAILHHNVDKSLLRAGETELKFNGGTVKQPILFVIGDRATNRIDGQRIDVEEIATKAAKAWFKKNMRFLDPEEHVKYQIELKPGSVGLTDIFKRKGKVLGANDTSAAVGYAPITRTEKTVLQTENYLNSEQFKKRFPESGEDIKVMAFRNGNDLRLTVAIAIVDRYINSEEDYFEKKAKILEEINRYVAVNTDFDLVDVQLNTLDVKGRGLGGLYLTVLGDLYIGSIFLNQLVKLCCERKCLQIVNCDISG
ncbi:methionine adenosyltransferase, partial [Candidatus Bathyarchaeota archaeon]|nr:methionine adenosyltransferase [Candidatus Bathyarchaeota archaeon]